MSRQSNLPPRCPFQTKSKAPLSTTNNNFSPRHGKSASQSFILEEQPQWVEDILSDAFENPKVTPLRRSVSDPVTILSGLNSDESLGLRQCNRSGLESSSVYGPNSPRTRDNVLSDNAVVSKLNDYFSRKPTYFLDSGVTESSMVRSELVRGAGGSAEVANLETNASRRHSGQRSRVRKLQYIAELERNVDSLQGLESELATQVASLLQHRVALSIENSALKQQLMTLKEEKVFVEGQYLLLKNELERLKAQLHARNNSTDFSSVSDEVDCEAVWQMLNIKKLNINQ